MYPLENDFCEKDRKLGQSSEEASIIIIKVSIRHLFNSIKIYIYMCVCVCVCVCIHIYIYIYIMDE